MSNNNEAGLRGLTLRKQRANITLHNAASTGRCVHGAVAGLAGRARDPTAELNKCEVQEMTCKKNSWLQKGTCPHPVMSLF